MDQPFRQVPVSIQPSRLTGSGSVAKAPPGKAPIAAEAAVARDATLR